MLETQKQMQIDSISDVLDLFFRDMKEFNKSNFKSIHTADLSKIDLSVYKSFSSIVTRYFIFCDKHPEISEEMRKLLYYKLKIDLIARFYTNYPVGDVKDLEAFKRELDMSIERMSEGAHTFG